MNKKGQALVEFIIVLPIMIMILLGIIDYTNMSYKRSKMDNIINDIKEMKEDNKTDEEINKFVKDNIDNNVVVNITYENNYMNIKLSSKYDCLTPGISKIFNDKSIIVERKVYYE